MATLSLYDATIGMSTQSLQTLGDLLKKAQEHPEAESLAATRLAPDMLPFSYQVIIVSNFAKKYVERLTGRELDVWADDETTLDQLVARVQKTLDLLKTVSRADVEGDAVTKVTLKMGPYPPFDATTQQYVLGYATPNIMFHLSIAYAILRMKGIELGKANLIKHFISDFFVPPAPAS